MNPTAILLLVSLLFCVPGLAQDVVLKKGKYLERSTGNPFSGIYKEMDEKGVLLSESSVSKGLLDGETRLYFPGGALKESRSYSAGQKHGTWTTWNEKGKKLAEANFSNGKKDGAWFVWDDKGTKRYEMFYKEGERSGTWIIRDESGKEISREVFPD